MEDLSQYLSSSPNSYNLRTNSSMMAGVQVKPVVLTILICTLAICNVTKPVPMLICIIALLIIHTPILEDLAIQLNLAKSPPWQTKLATRLVTNRHDAPAESLTNSSIDSTATLSSDKEPPSKQENRSTKPEQLVSEIRPNDERATIKSNKTTKKKSKGRKKTAACLQPSADGREETSLPKTDHFIPSAPIVDPEYANDGGWSLVSKKRRNTKPASERKANTLYQAPEVGERHLVLRNRHIVKRDGKEKCGSIASSSVSSSSMCLSLSTPPSTAANSDDGSQATAVLSNYGIDVYDWCEGIPQV